MLFHTTNNSTRPCIVCTATPSVRCQNCNAFHCAEHLVGVSCPGCSLELMATERTQLRGVAWVLLGLTVAACVATGYADSSVGFGVFSVVLWGTLATLVLAVSHSVIRRKQATRRLRPTSKPFVLVANSESTPHTPEMRKHESDYDARRRRNKMVVRRRAPRAVFMTRGGYFYQ